jgi:four helix bundle protein
MKKSILKEKSYNFAIGIVKLARYLAREESEFVLSKQILRSGTAIGALIREAEFAQSRADFTNKMSIALKEANETEYWLDLLKDSECIKEEFVARLKTECKELVAMLVSTVKTSKQKTNF